MNACCEHRHGFGGQSWICMCGQQWERDKAGGWVTVCTADELLRDMGSSRVVPVEPARPSCACNSNLEVGHEGPCTGLGRKDWYMNKHGDTVHDLVPRQDLVVEQAEVARLRKELEAAQKRLASPEDGIPFEQHNAVQDYLKRVRERNESQARTLQKFEERIGELQVNSGLDASIIRDLTRELEKAKRGAR